MKDDRLYLIHIGECIARIEQYVREGRGAFLTSTLIQDAVLRNLQTLAESSQRLSGSLRVQHPEVGWRAIAGFRNVLVHDYLSVDTERVWQIVDRDLPVLKSKLALILAEIGGTP
jgi:uncharacterized protein with HEPN domain